MSDKIVGFGKNDNGQFFYDVCMSKMSAVAVVRKWSKKNGVTREVVIEARKKYPEFRPNRADGKVGSPLRKKAKNETKSR